jgi:hypothetical protein
MCGGFAIGCLGGCMTMTANKHMDLPQRYGYLKDVE